MRGREIFTRGLYVFRFWRETLTERVGATLGVTIGATSGAGKLVAKLLIIRVGVRGVTKRKSCM